MSPRPKSGFPNITPDEALVIEILFYLHLKPNKGQRFWLTQKEIGKIINRHPDTIKRCLNSAGLFRLPLRRHKRRLSPRFDNQTSPQAPPAHYDR